MLALDDPIWKTLCGGYRTPYDPTNALRELYAGESEATAWSELWNELHHQGDVGEASYASVPHIVEIQKRRGDLDWNAYALISVIEIERHGPRNPPLPKWLEPAYEAAWKDLLAVALRDYALTTDPVTARAILGVLALCKGLRNIGFLASTFDESETKQIVDDFLGPAGA